MDKKTSLYYANIVGARQVDYAEVVELLICRLRHSGHRLFGVTFWFLRRRTHAVLEFLNPLGERCKSLAQALPFLVVVHPGQVFLHCRVGPPRGRKRTTKSLRFPPIRPRGGGNLVKQQGGI